jgi:hypothetical protein
MNSFKTYVIFWVILFCGSFSQAQNSKNSIIIWDVTASMVGSTNSQPPNYGYNASSDIDKEVRNGIIQLINETPSDGGIIRIMPFGTDIIANQQFDNNEAGKASGISYVQNYNIEKKPVGYTNICQAWVKAREFFTRDKETLIYLFTDGNQNVSFGNHGINCLSSIVSEYCEATRGTKNFTFFVSLNLPDNTFSAMLNNACSDNLAYIPVQNVKDGLHTPVLLQAMWDHVSINLQDSSLSSTGRFRLIGGVLPENFKINAELVLNEAQYHFDISSTILKNENGKVDFLFELEEIDSSTSPLKTFSNLNLQGTIKLTSNHEYIRFDPSELELSIINRKPQSLNFNIQ